MQGKLVTFYINFCHQFGHVWSSWSCIIDKKIWDHKYCLYSGWGLSGCG